MTLCSRRATGSRDAPDSPSQPSSGPEPAPHHQRPPAVPLCAHGCGKAGSAMHCPRLQHVWRSQAGRHVLDALPGAPCNGFKHHQPQRPCGRPAQQQHHQNPLRLPGANHPNLHHHLHAGPQQNGGSSHLRFLP